MIEQNFLIVYNGAIKTIVVDKDIITEENEVIRNNRKAKNIWLKQSFGNLKKSDSFDNPFVNCFDWIETNSLCEKLLNSKRILFEKYNQNVI